MVKHFLDKVCPPDVYKKLEIDEYLQQKLTQKQYQIQQEDNDTGHLLLVLDCLCALAQGPDASIAVLQEYAREHLVQHLSLVDLAMVDRKQKSQVGELLVKLFTSKECIDTFMWPKLCNIENSHMPRFVWLEDSPKFDEVLRWFKDTAVLSGVADESDRIWIQNLLSGNAFEVLLKPSIARMAHHCLREPVSAKEARENYRFVSKFLSKVGLSIPILEAECVVRFEQWIYEALRLAEKDTLRHTQMAMIFEIEHFEQETIERCELALDGS